MFAVHIRRQIVRWIESAQQRLDRAAFERNVQRLACPPRVDEFRLHASYGRFVFHLRQRGVASSEFVGDEYVGPVDARRQAKPVAETWPARHPGEMAQIANESHARRHRARIDA